MLKAIINQLKKTEHGFKHIMEAGDGLLSNTGTDHLKIAEDLLSDESYQGRMLATYLLGQLSAAHPAALTLLKTRVVCDDNWRVQEMLGKAIDHYCAAVGYERSLPEIKLWLADPQPNLNRAVIEGLRMWTGRPYFKHHPEVAIQLISVHKVNQSEYVRKSVGNALRDISKRHMELILTETKTWDLSNVKVKFVHQLIFGRNNMYVAT